MLYLILHMIRTHRKLHGSRNRPHEMHSVERKVLLEAFAGQIPQGTIRLNSQVTSIKKSETSPDVTNLELQDGSTYSAKVWPTLHALSNLQLQVSLSNHQPSLDILHVSCYKIIHYVWQVAKQRMKHIQVQNFVWDDNT